MDLVDMLREALAGTFGLFSESGEELTDVWRSLGQRAVVAGLVLVLYGALYVPARYLVLRAVRRLAPRLQADAPAMLRGAFWLLVLVSWSTMFPAARPFAGPLLRGGVLLLVLYAGWRLCDRALVRYLHRADLDPSLGLLARNSLGALFAVLGVYFVLREFEVNLVPVLGGLGVAGIAVGFAAQDILSNLIAGITLLLDRPFRIGDWVRLGDLEGRVERITLRTTRIRTRDNERIIVPNFEIASSQLVNLTAGGPLRLSIPVGIAYKERTEAARGVLMPLLIDDPAVLADPGPRIDVVELGDSSVNLVLRAWIAAESIPDAQQIEARLVEAAKRALDEADIEIPFPHLQLFIDDAHGLYPVADRVVGRIRSSG